MNEQPLASRRALQRTSQLPALLTNRYQQASQWTIYQLPLGPSVVLANLRSLPRSSPRALLLSLFWFVDPQSRGCLFRHSTFCLTWPSAKNFQSKNAKQQRI